METTTKTTTTMATPPQHHCKTIVLPHMPQMAPIIQTARQDITQRHPRCPPIETGSRASYVYHPIKRENNRKKTEQQAVGIVGGLLSVFFLLLFPLVSNIHH